MERTFGQSDDLRGARFNEVDLSGAWITESDVSGVVIRGSNVEGLEIEDPLLLKDSGSILLVNGVNVTTYVDAELNRRFPGRAERHASTPEGLRGAWEALQRSWAAAYERVAAMPPGTVDVSIAGEWSFAQTLRHLIAVTDLWLGKAILEREQPFHPLGLLRLDKSDAQRPTYEQVRAARADRVGMVLDFLATVTSDELVATHRNPHNPDRQETTLSCLHTIIRDEWEHLRYGVRDLDAIERDR